MEIHKSTGAMPAHVETGKIVKIYSRNDIGRRVATWGGSASKELLRERCVESVHVCAKITDEKYIGRGQDEWEGGIRSWMGQSISKPYL